MTEHKYKVGDIVKLKSGGPKMTVESVEGGNTYLCQWFDKEDRLERGKFPENCIAIPVKSKSVPIR
jgi:uncharacterized protein YodC (DUF2158 family)